ncbi:MAG: hypothetical protein HOP15_13635 [Planctomycetes bacterium]|nr:hypothetical protein [Planctomycetota bacterium]
MFRRASWPGWKKLTGLLLACACGLAANAQGTRVPAGRPVLRPHVIHVPAQSPTIQAAIDGAREGDVVIVAPGTYREDLDFRGKALEVIGVEGPARTILRPLNPGPVVRFRNGEGPDSRLMGFTIGGGSGDFEGVGGGVSCSGFNLGTVASPYLSDCIIRNNFTDPIFGNGGGAAGIDGNPILERCVLRQNQAYFESGGALRGSVTMLQCVVEDNWGCEGGGGLYLLPGSLVRDCVIRRNAAGPCGYHGGALQALGGGVFAPLGPVELLGCVLQNNWVDEYTEPGDPTACNGQNQGGGLVVGSGVTLRRCTIVGNYTEQCAETGGIHGNPTLIDSIVNGNEDLPGAYSALSSFRFSDVQGGAAGPGCFDADPLLIDATAGDVRLRDGSPCIDAGDPSSPLDPDGTRADLGAVHHPRANAPLSVAWHETARLAAADPAQSRRFGSAVAIAGDTALIGATEGRFGLSDGVYVFRRVGTGWSEEARLTPSAPETGNGFGAALALAGNVAIIGAPFHTTLSEANGAVYVFERSSAGAPFLETAMLVPTVQQSGESFGMAVALDSGFLVVGAPNSEWGRALVFERGLRGSWRQVAEFNGPDDYIPSYYGSLFGSAVAISGTTIVVGAPFLEVGAEVPGRAYVYERAGATPFSWVQSAALAPAGTSGLGSIGMSVSIFGDALFVGSNFGAFAYERNGPGLSWNRSTRIGPIEPVAVLVRGNRAWLRYPSGEKRELIQPSPGAPWSEVARFSSPAGPLAADQGTLLAGAPGEAHPTGACHLFTRGPQVNAIALDQAADAEPVAITGRDLDQVTRVLIDGVEQPVLAQSTTELRFLPAPREPGFADLTLETAAGSLVFPDGLRSAPTLSAGANGIGGTLEVELENGDAGALVLFYSFDLRAAPRPIVDPPTWYGLWLRLLPGRSGRLATDAFGASGRTGLSFDVPNDPALAGHSIHLQGLCRRGLFGPGRYSFTNLSSVAF